MRGVGFAIGLERLMLLLADKGIEVPDGHQLDVYVVGIGDETNVETLKLVQAIRGFGFSANRDFLGRKPKAQFKSANKENASFVITIGQSELDSRTAHFKSMVTSEEVSLPLDDLYTKFPEIYDKYIGE